VANHRQSSTKRDHEVTAVGPLDERVMVKIVSAEGASEAYTALVQRTFDVLALRHDTVRECIEILRGFEHTRSSESVLTFFLNPRASLGGRCPLEAAMAFDERSRLKAVALARAALE
jgi:hypothetical protein